MDQGSVMDLGRQALYVAFMVTLPILSVALFVGVVVSVFQAITQVQEMTLTFLPKILLAGIVLIMAGSWMLTTLVNFATVCFEQVSRVGA